MTLDELESLVWKWSDDRGMNDQVMQTVKMFEEAGEIAHEIIGICHHLNIEPAYALETAYNEIKDRKGVVIEGSFIKEEKGVVI